MVQRSFVLAIGLLLRLIEVTATTTTVANLSLNSSVETESSLASNTDLQQNRRSDLFTSRNLKRNSTFNYNLMRKYFIARSKSNARSPKSYYEYYNTNNTNNKSASEVKSKLLSSPYLYDILKTNISRIVKNVVKYAQNYTNVLNGSNNVALHSKRRENKINITDSSYNGTQNKTLPSLLRTFRSNTDNNKTNSNKQVKTSIRRQRNDERDRHRHSKRVNMDKPINFLLPPFVTDYPELSQEIGHFRKANDLRGDARYPLGFNQSDSYTTLPVTNRDVHYKQINRNNSSEINVQQKRRRLKQSSPLYSLKQPIITFTTTDHVFYVTPKVKVQKIKQTPTELQTIPTTPIDYETNSVSFYDLYTTQRTTPFDSKKLEKYYDTGVINNDNQITNSPANYQEETLQTTTQNWLTSSTFSEYNATNRNIYYDNNTTNFDNLITQPVLNDGNFGLKNLSLYYLTNDNFDYSKSSNSTFKNNYYLPNTSYTTTVSTPSVENIDFKLAEYQSHYIPIHDINSMTTVKETYYDNRDETLYDGGTKSFTASPLLSSDVEKAGMKIYKLTDITSNNVTQIPWVNYNNYDQKKEEDNEIERVIQSIMVWKEQLDRHINNENYNEGIPIDASYNLSSKDALLYAAETRYHRNPEFLGNLSQYVPHQSYLDQHQVIPGAAGEDYPTLSKPPSSSRYSCTNDGRRYVADVSTGCQVFIMCVGDGPGEPMLCPNGTLFSQDYLVCDWWYNVDCR